MKKLIKVYNNFFIKYRKKQEAITMKKVIVFSNTALGDIILSTPSIKSLKKSFPNLHIELIVNKSVYKLYKDFEYVQNVVVYDKSFLGLLSHIRYLKKGNFDTIFFLHSNGPQDLFIALASKVNNILKAINYPSKISKEFSKFILNEPDYKNKKHIIEHRLDLIRYFKPAILDLELSLPAKFYNNLKRKKLLTIGIQLGAADSYKMWPLENFIKLLNSFSTKYDKEFEVLFFGIQSEKKLASKVIDNLKNISCKNLCGKTDIEKLPFKIQEVDFLITNDTGTLHLAVALKVPTISLFSPTDSKIFGPYEEFDKHIIIQKDGEFINNKPKKSRGQEAMKLILVKEVLESMFIQIKRLNICVE